MRHALARGVLICTFVLPSAAFADPTSPSTTSAAPAQALQVVAQTPATAVTPAVATAPTSQTTPVVTPMSATDATTAAATPVSDRNTLVCRRLDPPTGTRLGGRTVCATVAQWDAVTRHSEDAISGFQDRGGEAHIPGGP